ncbi:hypothetical protein D3C81_2145360 [compost metagenome]
MARLPTWSRNTVAKRSFMPAACVAFMSSSRSLDQLPVITVSGVAERMRAT